MLRIKVPATSANLGPGFDCLGIAWNLCSTFLAEPAEQDCLEGVEERFAGPDNLFLKAFHRGCRAAGADMCVRAVFRCDIPVSRGLGSSAALIAGGLSAASALNGNALTKEQIFQLSSEMEGHPDNAAPAVFGGFTASLQDGTKYLTRKIPLAPCWHFTLFIPGFEVSTEAARHILPGSYPRTEAAGNAARAILTAEALRCGDMGLLRTAARDVLHEPYRAQLIQNYDDIRHMAEEAGCVFLISGSGSTCLSISDRPLPEECAASVRRRFGWQVITVSPMQEGTGIFYE